MRIRFLPLALLCLIVWSSVSAAAETTRYPVQNASTVHPDATPAASGTATPGASPAASTPITGYIIGDPQAPVTVTIWSDYQCSHCRALHQDVLPRVLQTHVTTGQVKIQMFDLPVIGVNSIDQLGDDSLESVQAAEAVMCAADQNAYLPYSNRLMEGAITPNSGAFSDEHLIGFARDLKLDLDRFTHCLASGKYESAVIAMFNQGLDSGVQGTPAVIVNSGEILYGPTYEELSKAIDAELEK